MVPLSETFHATGAALLWKIKLPVSRPASNASLIWSSSSEGKTAASFRQKCLYFVRFPDAVHRIDLQKKIEG